MRRQLAALGYPLFEPTDQQRLLVEALAFNETPEARIAEALSISLVELRYHFHRELNYTKDMILAVCMQNMRNLANQTGDPGVALKANHIMLATRLKVWREPKEEAPVVPIETRVDELSLDEVQREIARVRGLSPEPAGEGGEAPEPEVGSG